MLNLQRRVSAAATTTDSQKIKTEPVAEIQWWLEKSTILNKETETQNPESSVSVADERSAKIEYWWLVILKNITLPTLFLCWTLKISRMLINMYNNDAGTTGNSSLVLFCKWPEIIKQIWRVNITTLTNPSINYSSNVYHFVINVGRRKIYQLGEIHTSILTYLFAIFTKPYM